MTASRSLSLALNASSYSATQVIDPMVTLLEGLGNLSLINIGMLNSSQILAKSSSSRMDSIASKVSSIAIHFATEPLGTHQKSKAREREGEGRRRKKKERDLPLSSQHSNSSNR